MGGNFRERLCYSGELLGGVLRKAVSVIEFKINKKFRLARYKHRIVFFSDFTYFYYYYFFNHGITNLKGKNSLHFHISYFSTQNGKKKK